MARRSAAFIGTLEVHFQKGERTMIKRMTWTTRLQIEKLFNSGASYRQIARHISFSVSSVYAEIQRGLYDHLDGATWKTVKYYSAQIADDDACYFSWLSCQAG